MTRLRRNPDDITNYIDELVDGIGMRSSSFSDVDRLTAVHNGGRAPRWWFQSNKWRAEWDNQSPGQRKSHEWFLKDLARVDPFTVVAVIVEPDKSITLRDYGTSSQHHLTPAQYRARFKEWWDPSNGARPSTAAGER